MRTQAVGLTISLTLLLSLPATGQDVKRILLVGDSYVQSAYLWDIPDQVLHAQGLGQYTAEGARTTIGGLSAEDLAANNESHLDRVIAELLAQPTLDIVHLGLGGIEVINLPYLLAIYTPAQIEEHLTNIQDDIQFVADTILGVRPDIRVAIAGYDYMNMAIFTAPYADSVEGVTQRMFNDAAVDLGRKKRAIAEGTDRCHYVQSWGTLQHHFGVPGVYEPGEVPLPGQAPDYEPMPGGDPDYSMAPENYLWEDGVHPSPEGLGVLFENVVNLLYRDWLNNPLPPPEGEGEGEGGSETCGPGSLFGQHPQGILDSPTFVASDEQVGAIFYDDFSGLAGDVGSIRWWGSHSDLTLDPCDRGLDAYRVTFYQDDGGAPGAETVHYIVAPGKQETGTVYFGQYPLYAYEAVLDPPLAQTDGWISIEGFLNDQDCKFLGITSSEGNGLVLHRAGTGDPLLAHSRDVAFCLMATGSSHGEGEGEGTGGGEGEGEGTGGGEGEGEGTGGGEGEGEGTGGGEGEGEGTGGGEGEGEGTGGGEGEGEPFHAADFDDPRDHTVNVTELLRIVQFYNTQGYHCADPPESSEDGYAPGKGLDQCDPHSADYKYGPDWHIGLSELLRVVQFYNSGGYHACPEAGTEDGFCTGTP